MNADEQGTATPVTQGIHHLGLSVPNISETRDFFVQQLGYQQIGEKPDYPAFFVSDGATMITLWQLGEESEPVTFDRRKNVGLHHFALKVGDADALAELHQRLDGSGLVNVEFAPEALGNSGLHHMMCTIPGGLRVEFISA